MKTHLLILTIFLLCQLGWSQTLTITNGSKTKEVPVNSHVLIKSRSTNAVFKNNTCCTFNSISGTLKEVRTNTVIVEADSYEFATDFELKTEDASILIPKNKNLTINKADLLELQYYKSEKNKRFRNTMSTIGGLLLVGGALSAINGVAVASGDSRRDLFIASAAQAGLGLTIGLATVRSSHYFNPEGGGIWQVK